MNRTAVIILNWNGRQLLERYLPQVIASTSGADIIVADNASTDGSQELLRQNFPQIQIIQLDRNHGFAGGYNRAIEQVEHEYVVLLNSDVAPAPGWLDPLVSLMDRHTMLAACAPKIKDDKQHDAFEYAGAAGGYIDWLGYPFCRGRIMDNIETDCGQYNDTVSALWVSGAALLVRRSAYLECGGLDESFFAHMEEIDLCWRLRNRGYEIAACGSSEVYHLGGATLNKSNPRKTYLNFRNNLRMLIKNYNSHIWPLVLFLRLMLDGVAGIKFLAEGKPRFCFAIVRAHWHIFARMGRLLRQRNKLRRSRVNILPPEVRKYSLIWRHYALGETTFTNIDKGESLNVIL